MRGKSKVSKISHDSFHGDFAQHVHLVLHHRHWGIGVKQVGDGHETQGAQTEFERIAVFERIVSRVHLPLVSLRMTREESRNGAPERVPAFVLARRVPAFPTTTDDDDAFYLFPTTTERVCCLLVLNSVTTTPQWIRQLKLRDEQ